MACNCLCCGCQTCTEAQEGKCCCGGPSGTCCQPGEFCCNGTCLPGGCTGACCVEGDCSVTTEAECAGTWQGAFTTCDDGSCEELCCRPYGDCDGVPYIECVSGYFYSACLAAGGTVPEDCSGPAHPGTGQPRCEDGNGPTSVTVTVDGVVANDSANDDVAAACNSSFVIDLNCVLGQDQNDITVATVRGFSIRVAVQLLYDFGTVSASVTILPPGQGTGDGATHSDTGRLPEVYTDCAGLPIYDCTDYGLAAGKTSETYNQFQFDFSNATIELA